MAMNLFETSTMTLTSEDGTTIQADLPVQLDTVNVAWNADVGGLVPDDSYDLYSIGWTTPIPQRGQYFVDQQSGARYQVFSNPAPYLDHIECRVTRYPGGA